MDENHDNGNAIARRTFLAGAAATAAAGLSGCIGGIGSGGVEVSETVAETYDASGLDALSVGSPNGEITVEGSDRETISLTAEKEASSQELLDAATVTADREGSRLSIDVDVGDTGLFETPPQVDMTVEMPSSLRLAEVATVNGVVDVSDVRGPLTVEGVNGDITVSDVDGGVTVEVTNGEIAVDHVTGDVRAEATNGDVDVENVDGDVFVDTTNGDIDVDTVSGDATIDTVNGDISVSNVDGEVDT